MEESGYADTATRIRIRLEGNVTRLGDFGFWKLLGRYVLAVTIRYGYRPSYAISVLLIWTALTWLALTNALPGQLIEADAKSASTGTSTGGKPSPSPASVSSSPYD